MGQNQTVQSQTAQSQTDGMVYLGSVAPPQQELLQETLAAGREKLATAWAASTASLEIFWISLWRRSSHEPPMEIARIAELDRWVHELLATAYPDDDVQLEGYGFIINPVGSKSQLWHIDYYTLNYSNVFIPLSKLTPENATQYVVLPPETPQSAKETLAAQDAVDLNQVVELFGHVTVRQMLAKPFSILRMDFGAIHRGIANTGGFERILFWVSVTRGGIEVPPEASVEYFNPFREAEAQ